MLKQEFVYQEYVRREKNVVHAPYNPELEFYSLIKAGDINAINEACKNPFTKKTGFGILSDNKLQNFKYHLVITLAMIARYCIEGGLDVTTAFSVSDFYIQKADKATTFEEIDKYHHLACIDYATRMKAVHKKTITSKHVSKCIDYINEHLHTKISLEELAEYVNLNPTYLSRLFKSETGETVREFITNTKVDTAKNMLIYSDYGPAEIASILAFSDQSYFTEVFRKYTGMTPKKYQSNHLREIKIGSNLSNKNE